MVGQDREAGSNGAITSSSISTKSTRAATSRRGMSRNSSAPRSGRPSLQISALRAHRFSGRSSGRRAKPEIWRRGGLSTQRKPALSQLNARGYAAAPKRKTLQEYSRGNQLFYT